MVLLCIMNIGWNAVYSSVGRATHGCFIQDDVFHVLFIRQFTGERTFFSCCYFISFLPSINSARKESTKVASASAAAAGIIHVLGH